MSFENEKVPTETDAGGDWGSTGRVLSGASGLCRAIKKNGEPCRLLAISDGWCFAHSPALAEKRRAAWAAGGAASSRAERLKKLAPSRLGPVTAMLEDVLEGLNSGKKDARTAQAIASVSRALIAVITAGETEERLRLLEEKFAGLDDK